MSSKFPANVYLNYVSNVLTLLKVHQLLIQQSVNCSFIIIDRQLQSFPFGFSIKTKPAVASGHLLVWTRQVLRRAQTDLNTAERLFTG